MTGSGAGRGSPRTASGLTSAQWRLALEAVRELRRKYDGPSAPFSAGKLADLTALETRMHELSGTPARGNTAGNALVGFRPDPNGRGCLCSRTGLPYRLCPVHGTHKGTRPAPRNEA